MTHKQNLQQIIDFAKFDNPDATEIVVKLSKDDYRTIDGIEDLPARIIISKKVERGKIVVVPVFAKPVFTKKQKIKIWILKNAMLAYSFLKKKINIMFKSIKRFG